MTSNREDTPFPLLYHWLGAEAEEYIDFETIYDYDAYQEHLEMTALGY